MTDTTAREVITRHLIDRWYLEAGDNPPPTLTANDKLFYEDTDAILSALSAAGYVVVPKEPTKEIIHAAEMVRFHRGFGQPPISESEVYRAMLAAAEKESKE